jgi:hypothetical protein
LLIAISVLIGLCSFGPQFTDLRGDYPSLPLPGETPVVFALGIFPDEYQQHGAPTFSPDGNEVFWQKNVFKIMLWEGKTGVMALLLFRK